MINKTNRIFSGVVVNDSAEKTIVVSVAAYETHAKYGKKVRVTKKYHVHDPSNQHKTGERVRFCASRPYSRMKRFHIID